MASRTLTSAHATDGRGVGQQIGSHSGRAPLVEAALAGDRRALARVLSWVEAGGLEAEGVLHQAYATAGDAHLVGVTGAPGTGKSTLVARLAAAARRRAQQVAVVAVDPSSPYTRGALLGDRVRMGALSGDAGVFVRSMASRGAAGGLAEAAAGVIAVLAVAGFDLVLIETVGAGQGELDVAGAAQTTLVVTAPGLGDDVQALKAGILEIADILVVNKSDREGADRLVAELRFAAGADGHAPHTQEGQPGRWAVPIVKTVATHGDGVDTLMAAIAQHRGWLETSGAGHARARALAERQILDWTGAKARRQAETTARATGQLTRLVDEVAARRLSPPAAADVLLRAGGLTPSAGTAPPDEQPRRSEAR